MDANIILNAVWFVLCAGAVYLQLRSRASRLSSPRARRRGLLAVLLATVAIFPCVSATDDSTRITYFATQGQATSEAPDRATEKNSATLVRLFEEIEHAQIQVGVSLALTFLLFAIVTALCPSSIHRLLPALAGRAPPLRFASAR